MLEHQTREYWWASHVVRGRTPPWVSGSPYPRQTAISLLRSMGRRRGRRLYQSARRNLREAGILPKRTREV